jgi:hypothetical protein
MNPSKSQSRRNLKLTFFGKILTCIHLIDIVKEILVWCHNI